MKLSIIIINYRSYNLVSNCLNSIMDNAPASSHEVIVVDNDSRDGSYEELKKVWGDTVQIVQSGKNNGFSWGNNIGAKLAKGEYFFFLNADTILLPGVLDEMVAFLDSHEEYGALTCNSVNANNEILNNGHSFPTLTSFAIKTLIDPIIPGSFKVRMRRKVTEESSDLILVKDWISGSGLLIPASLFWKIGGWDEQYFMYMEDVSLCKEIKKDDKRCALYNKLGFIHYVNGSGPSRRIMIERSRSEIKYFMRYSSVSGGVVKTIVLLRALIFAWRNKMNDISGIIKMIKKD